MAVDERGKLFNSKDFKPVTEVVEVCGRKITIHTALIRPECNSPLVVDQAYHDWSPKHIRWFRLEPNDIYSEPRDFGSRSELLIYFHNIWRKSESFGGE